ncbi:response regulator transcription factor [Aquincola sp. S2]|uniref:Response regulator transcription factor n=1 Tax=Pseudaquabacterium terrae TaxID=2732868 RepID=A0ABX2EF58_9BURK|nr:response regulator [Aquabacterium terrae]NRF67249.1 response regulator transcription factor [Aquabacterium terrae]
MSKRSMVYIVDDNLEFREATRFWLAGCGFEVQAWGDPREAVEALARRDRSERCCLMLDVRMPELSGLDVHDRLAELDAAPPVIYMSGHADVPLAVEAMRKGAVTLLEKPFDDEALEAALDAAFASGASSRSPGVPAPDAAAPRDGEDDEAQRRFTAREAALTPRERQVLGHVIQGTYNKNIADRIGLSIKTVELYRARGMAKMKARSVAELTRMMVSGRA